MTALSDWDPKIMAAFMSKKKYHVPGDVNKPQGFYPSNSKFQYSENQKTPEKFAGFPFGWKKMVNLLSRQPPAIQGRPTI
jgi:hypothetical protein